MNVYPSMILFFSFLLYLQRLNFNDSSIFDVNDDEANNERKIIFKSAVNSSQMKNGDHFKWTFLLSNAPSTLTIFIKLWKDIKDCKEMFFKYCWWNVSSVLDLSVEAILSFPLSVVSQDRYVTFSRPSIIHSMKWNS